MLEKTREKLGIKDIYRVAKCGQGFHLKIPPKIARAFELESGDEIYLTLHEVRYKRMRETEENKR